MSWFGFLTPPCIPDTVSRSGVREGCLHVKKKKKKVAYSLVCSLSGEVGQKAPEVMDAWLQNLCARLRPRATD